MNFNLKKPCADCPFRTDKPHQKGWLGRERAQEIADAITQLDGTFTCHKTLQQPQALQQHCAGAMIMLEHLEQPNQMMRIAERLGLYDHTQLNMTAPTHSTVEDFVDFHTPK